MQKSAAWQKKDFDGRLGLTGEDGYRRICRREGPAGALLLGQACRACGKVCNAVPTCRIMGNANDYSDLRIVFKKTDPVPVLLTGGHRRERYGRP